MKIVYARQPFPESWSSAIFLAGPTPRSENPVPSWRPEALSWLERAGYDGVVFVPEPPEGNWEKDYQGQVDWETCGLHLADVIVFWIPRDLSTMPAFTTNVEFGRWVDSGKCVVGWPERAPKNRYLGTIALQAGCGPIHGTLPETLGCALQRLGSGAPRSGGERYIPLHLWKTPMLQSWRRQLQAAGHRLEQARVRWISPGPDAPLAAVLWASAWVEQEQRREDSEWLLASPEGHVRIVAGR